MTTFNEGDRVEMIVNPRMTGVVTGDKDTVFTSFVCVQWASGDFARVNPMYLQHVEATTYERDMAAIDRAQRLAAITLDRLEAEVGIVFAGSHNPADIGIEVADWQTRAEQAEAAIKRVEAVYRYYDSHDRPRGMHRFAVAKRLRAALDADQ